MRGAEYAELAAFVAVARERSFRRAATRLGLSPSALSRVIRGLEERLGTRLLNRTTRSVAPTDEGTRLYDRLEGAMSEISDAVAAVGEHNEKPSGTVRLNLPKLVASVLFAGNLGDFSLEYPDIRLELTVDDGFSDIVAGGFDAGIRPAESVPRDMVAIPVTGKMYVAVVGSPGYFETHSKPHGPLDLKDHSCINYRFAATGALYKWSFAKRGKEIVVAVDGNLTVNDIDLCVQGALDGAGLAYVLEKYAEPYIESGRLVRVLDDWCVPFGGFHLYYPGRRQMPATLRALITFLATRLKH
jgi:DNA-binding transcriptional LysR family regulator